MEFDRFYQVQIATGIVTLAILVAMVWKGRLPERLAAVAFATVEYGTSVLTTLVLNEFRIGVAILSFALLASLTILALRFERWWLIVAAGIQLVSVTTWAVSTIDVVPIWAAVTVRLIVWWLLMAASIFGIVEARRAPYANPGVSNVKPKRRGSLAQPLPHAERG